MGCFPGGESPFGCEDMSGNVWEWTRSLWALGSDTSIFEYPYDPADKRREDLPAGNDVERVLRGGAFYNYARSARCAFRFNRDPDFRDYHLGFRVVLSPFFSER